MLFLPQQHDFPTHQLFGVEVYLCIAASHSKSGAQTHKFCLCHRSDIRTNFARTAACHEPFEIANSSIYIHKLCLCSLPLRPNYRFERTVSLVNSTNGKNNFCEIIFHLLWLTVCAIDARIKSQKSNKQVH